MELLIVLLVAAAAVVLALGPLFGKLPAGFDDHDEAAPAPSDREAVLEDVATGKLDPSVAAEEGGAP